MDRIYGGSGTSLQIRAYIPGFMGSVAMEASVKVGKYFLTYIHYILACV